MRTLCLSVVLLLFSVIVQAADPAPKLPVVGSWAKYDVQVVLHNGEEEWREISLRFLEPTVVDGVKCHWIEFVYHPTESDEKPFTSVTKLAVAEKQLLQGPIKLSGKLHGYWSSHSQDAEPDVATITQLKKEGSIFVLDMFMGNYLRFLPGPSQSTKFDEVKKVVDYQQGRLISEQVLSGTSEGEYEDSFGEPTHWKCRYQIHPHPQLPFGFAAAEFNWETTYPNAPDREPSGHWTKRETWTIQEFGTGAKSSLPESH